MSDEDFVSWLWRLDEDAWNMRVIQMDKGQVLLMLSGLAFQHGKEVNAGMQLRDLYNKHANEFAQIYSEYQKAMSQSSGDPMDEAVVIAELLKAHPDIAPLIVQALGIIGPFIPELQQTITQLQSRVMAM